MEICIKNYVNYGFFQTKEKFTNNKNSIKYLNRKIEDLNVRNGDLNPRKSYLNACKKR